MRVRIGVDLGGTKIEAIALDAEGRELGAAPRADAARRLRRHAGRDRRPGRGHRARRWASRRRVGVGMPGAISPAPGLVKNANSTWLNGRPLARRPGARAGRAGALRQRRQLLRAVRGDRRRGARARAVVFGVIVGTGVGGGIVIERPRLGRARTASPANGATTRCPGRATTSGPGPPCYCGRTGCIETFLSGPGPRARPRARDRRARDRGRRSPSARPRAMRRRAGDARALRATGWRAALATVINVLDPDVIVLGGGLSQHRPLCTTSVPRAAGALRLLGRGRHAAASAAPRRRQRRARRGLAVVAGREPVCHAALRRPLRSP